MGIIYSFWLYPHGKTGKQISESSRLTLLEKFSSHQFALLDENNLAFGALNRGGIVNLTFLRIILAVCQKSPKPSLMKTKEAIFMGYSNSTRCWKSERSLILALIFMIRNMCINSELDPLNKFTNTCSRRINFTDILPWSISLMITKILN